MVGRSTGPGGTTSSWQGGAMSLRRGSSARARFGVARATREGGERAGRWRWMGVGWRRGEVGIGLWSLRRWWRGCGWAAWDWDEVRGESMQPKQFVSTPSPFFDQTRRYPVHCHGIGYIYIVSKYCVEH